MLPVLSKSGRRRGCAGELRLNPASFRKGRRTLARILLAIGAATLLIPPAFAVSYRWAGSSNRIYVDGPGIVTLTDIQANLPLLPTNSLVLVDSNNYVWYLGVNLIIEAGAQLNLHGRAIGGDVNELRLKSDNTSSSNAIVELRADWGDLDIRNIKITSWDAAANGPDLETDTYGRAFIHARSSLDPDGITAHESRMDVVNSEICYLGSHNTEAYGLVWKVVDTSATNLPAGSTNTIFDVVNVYGDILNCHLHHNFFGMYSYGHYGGHWANNEVDHNIWYGFDPHDDSDSELIENNNVHDNGKHGIIASKRCDHRIIRNNISWANAENGIMLHRHDNDSLIESNLCFLNADSGIAIFDTERAEVRYNTCVSNSNAGIRLSVDAANNLVESNEFGFNLQHGIYLFQGSSSPEPDDTDPITNGRPRLNVFANNFVHDTFAEAVKVQQGDTNIFLLNNISGSGTTLRFENSTNNLVASNSLPSDVLIKTIGSPTNTTATLIKAQPRVRLQPDQYSVAIFLSDNGAVFDFGTANVPTTVSPAGSAASVTLADLGVTATIFTRNLCLVPDAGTVVAEPAVWNLGGDLSKAWTAQSSNGTSSITCRVGDLTPGTFYAVTVGSPGTFLGSYTADPLGFITFVAANGAVSLAASNLFSVQSTSTPPNSPPGLPSLGDVTWPELVPLTITNTATDNDMPANVLSYQLVNPPAGAAIDSSGIITWIPDESQGPGSYVLTTIVTDNGVPPLSGTNHFMVNVTEVNSAPSLPPQSNVTVAELTPLTITNTASDSDLPGNLLAYVLVDPPSGAGIDANGIISWTPSPTQASGTNTIVTVVTDNGAPALSATNTFTVTVTMMALQIQLAGSDTAVLTWPSPAPGWTLQSFNLAGADGWLNSTNAVTVIGGRSQIVISLLTDGQLFRLFHP